MEAFVSSGNPPIRNFRDGDFPNAKALDARTIKEKIGIGMESCYACPARCKKVVKVAEPWRVDPIYGGPEYEALAVFGSNCGVEDLKAVCKANEICNRYSLDVLSTGDTIAFAMECYENGILTDTDTGGLKLEFCVINLPAIPRSYGRRFETNLKGLFLCESVIFTFCSVDHDC